MIDWRLSELPVHQHRLDKYPQLIYSTDNTFYQHSVVLIQCCEIYDAQNQFTATDEISREVRIYPTTFPFVGCMPTTPFLSLSQ
jgi:hypothetical protein